MRASRPRLSVRPRLIMGKTVVMSENSGVDNQPEKPENDAYKRNLIGFHHITEHAK